MGADGAVDVMVLAVDVAGDRSPDRHEARARCDRHEEPSRHDDPQQLVDADAGANGDLAAHGVESDVARTCGDMKYQSSTVLRGIAVAAPEATNQDATRPCFLERCGK